MSAGIERSQVRRRGRRGPSVRARVALLIATVCAGAFAIAYLGIVPELASTLERNRLQQLERAMALTAPRLAESLRASGASEASRTIHELPESFEARVAIFRADAGNSARSRPSLVDDAAPPPPAQFERAARSALSKNRQVALVSGHGAQRMALVARPFEDAFGGRYVVVYGRSLDDVARTMALLRERGAFALALAMGFALLGALAVSQALTGRVRAVERAARELARGRQPPPVPVERNDEFGALADAFNEMQERLTQAERARREFIVTASHELRTPLSSLGGFVELLQDEELDPETRRRFLATMAEQVERLQRLAVDLLDLSRIDSGELHLEPALTDLRELAHSVASEFEPAIAERGVHLDLRAGAATLAWCDPERTAQVLRILLDNAIRHTPPGTRVRISVGRSLGGDRAYVRVIDNGPGVPPDLVRRVFEPFTRGENSRGAGLGLAIARELVERMGGRIFVRSGGGETKFEVALPLAPADRAAARDGGSRSPLTASRRPPMGT